MKEYPYWWDTVPAAPLASGVGDPPPRVDLAIVGAGITGLAAAREAARAGATVAVFERECTGWGASSRNGGQVLTGLKIDAITLVARYGEQRAREMFDAAGDSQRALEALIHAEGIECEYRRAGHLQAACKPQHFRAFEHEREVLSRVFRHAVTLVSQRDQHAELGSDRYFGLLVDEASAGLNPAKYVRGLCAAAVRAGARVFEHLAVERLTRATGGWRVATSRGTTDAASVLIATDGYTDAVAPALRRRLVPVGSYIVATQPLGEAAARALLPKGRMAFDSKHFLYYFRVTDDHRLLFGGRARFTTPTPDSTRRAASALTRGFREVFPQLADAAVEYAWGGNVAFTRDEMPHAGCLDGCHYAAGYCGHGVAMATELGALIVRRIAGERIDHPFVDRPFPRIPLYSGRPWFLPLVGGYYRFRDWIA